MRFRRPLTAQRTAPWRESDPPSLILLIALAFGIVLVLAVAPPEVSAHAGLVESDPPANVLLEDAPDSVTMRFTEPLERGYSTAELYDEDGNVVAGTSISEGSDEYDMVLNVPTDLPDGTYSVLWRTLSTADGHTAQNYFAFTVGSGVDVGAVVAPTTARGSEGPPLWLQALSRWAALLGLAAAVAIWPIWLYVVRPAAAPAWHVAPQLTRRMRRYAVVAIVAALAGNLLALLVQSAALPDGSLIDNVRITIGETRYGELWFIRFGLLLVYALVLQWVAWWWPRHNALLANLALLTALALPIPFSFIAHASAQTAGRNIAILNDVLHLLAASLWVGGLFALFIVLVPVIWKVDGVQRRQVLSRALPRFSIIALTAWSTLILTGIYSAWLQVGSLEALRTTDYGNALVLKLALLIPILLLAAFNLFAVTNHLARAAADPNEVNSWTRRFAGAIGGEALIAIAVLAVVGSLTAQAPARETVAQEVDTTEIVLTSDEHSARLSLAPGTAGPNQFELTIAGGPLPDNTDVLMRIESQSQGTGEKELEFERIEDNTYVHTGSELSIAGEWDFELLVRPPAASEWRAYATETISAGVAARGASGTNTPSWVLSRTPGIIGMLLAFAGIASIIVAWQRRRFPYRSSYAIRGAALLLLGAALLAQSRSDPVEATVMILRFFL